MPSAVVVQGLRKSYAEVAAVQGVSFDVQVGEIFALLGPNGAGKTSIIEILEGFRVRDAGTVDVLGFDPANRATSRVLRERLGIVLQELAVEPFLTVREVLSRNAGFYPAPRDLNEVIDAVGLSEKADARVKTLSGGQQRRLDVALGIVGDPELVFLDEPTTGFDPSARRGAWDLVRSLRERGTTVILTTHYMDEAENLADRVAIINAGRIVALGDPESLGGRDVGEVRVRFRLPTGVAASDLPLPSTATVDEDGMVEIKTTDDIELLHNLTSWSLGHAQPLVGLTVERLTLEDVYLRITGYQSGDGSSPGHEPAGRSRRQPASRSSKAGN